MSREAHAPFLEGLWGKFPRSTHLAMREDDCRIRRGNAPEMLSGIRHIAVNLLNNTKTFKAGLKRKQKKAAMSIHYLSEVLAGCGAS